MTEEEKLAFVSDFIDTETLTEEHFEILIELSFDDDDFIRCRVARCLINFLTDESKEALFRLAQDNDELVRTEAFDSLSVFPSYDVVELAEEAIHNEKDELARSYAILAWADVLALLKDIPDEKIEFAIKHKAEEESDRNKLNWCYALIKFGDESVLEEMLEYLNNDDYHIRCSVINLCKDIVNHDNKAQIIKAIEKLLVYEYSTAVSDTGERFIKSIETL
jgi:HEAT repeat protein